jgi:hypothetical protein
VNSRLKPIESNTFSDSSLQLIVIPGNVQFIDGSAFINVTLSSISIESGNEYFLVINEFLIDTPLHKFIHHFSKSPNIEIAGPGDCMKISVSRYFDCTRDGIQRDHLYGSVVLVTD